MKIPRQMPEYGAFKHRVVIWRIHRALRKIREGSYGICDGCSRAIDDRRLDLIPAAVLCLACQEKYETGASR